MRLPRLCPLCFGLASFCSFRLAVCKILGEYGMLSEFDVDVHTARERVKEMKLQFGIREFEFYNMFEGYSYPPDVNAKDQWYCRCFNRPVFKQIVQAYIDEINQEPKGRAWLSVQMMGSDPDDPVEQGFMKIGSHNIDDHPLLDVIVPTVAWAEKITHRWAEFAMSLGLSGVNWATMGDYNGTSQKGGDVPGFLRHAKPILEEHGLEQIGLFVDGFGWEEELVTDGTIAFTYWAFYQNVEAQTQNFFKYVTDPGVFTSTLKGSEEDAFRILISRWQQALCRNFYYFAIGDGHKRLTTDYYPAAVKLANEEIIALQGAVSGVLNCDGHEQDSRLSLPMRMPPPTKPPPETTTTLPETHTTFTTRRTRTTTTLQETVTTVTSATTETTVTTTVETQPPLSVQQVDVYTTTPRPTVTATRPHMQVVMSVIGFREKVSPPEALGTIMNNVEVIAASLRRQPGYLEVNNITVTPLQAQVSSTGATGAWTSTSGSFHPVSLSGGAAAEATHVRVLRDSEDSLRPDERELQIRVRASCLGPCRPPYAGSLGSDMEDAYRAQGNDVHVTVTSFDAGEGHWQALPHASWSLYTAFGAKQNFLGILLGTALLLATSAMTLSGGCCWLGRSYRKFTRLDREMELRDYDPAAFISHAPRTVTGDEPLAELGSA